MAARSKLFEPGIRAARIDVDSAPSVFTSWVSTTNGAKANRYTPSTRAATSTTNERPPRMGASAEPIVSSM